MRITRPYMLRDLIASLTTRCSPYLRRMGYLDEMIAMRRRSEQRRAAWQPHLGRSMQFILGSAERCSSRKKVIILGSGLLLDVPLAELSRLFGEVVLMDVICLPEIGREIARHPNVRFLEYDVTGVSERLYQNSRQASADLPGVRQSSSPEFKNADLVVSLNLLSQVWVIPRAFVMQLRNRPGQEQLDEWCEQLVEEHYRFLRSLPCVVCLIADQEFVKRDTAGDVISKASSVYDLALPKPDAAWTWNIAPLGSESSFFSKELTVGAWHAAQGTGTLDRLTLRPVTEDDIHAVAQWPAYTGVLHQMDYAVRRGGWLDELRGKPETTCFIAEKGGLIVGFTLLRKTVENKAEVRIALHPDWTGRGVGKEVMGEVLERAFSDPALTRIDLIVRKNNVPAMKLYRKLGFVVRGESKHVIQGGDIDFFDMDLSREDFMQLRKAEGR